MKEKFFRKGLKVILTTDNFKLFVCVFNTAGTFRQTSHSLAPAALGASPSMRRAQQRRITTFACQTYV